MELSGYASTLTDQQKEVLEEIKGWLEKGEGIDATVREAALNFPGGDDFLLRCLRATMKGKGKKRIFQAEEAKKRIVSCFEFRIKYGLLDLENKPERQSEFLEVYPHLHFLDENVRKVIWLTRTGEFAGYGKMTHFTEDEW
eukprot:maker-scaffold_7-snap-gene-19.76-mRNA-1 protein AED:0.00 eAED:0.00 QI:128/1/1/1/0/0.5/2/604/140